VVCEGRVTEPEYVRGFSRWCRNPLVEVEVAEGHGVPLTLVRIAKARKHASGREARRARDENLSFDEVWCVFDVDEHPALGEAREMARANGIRLAVSNPCFELWLLLHFRESPGARHRHEVQRMVAELIPGYDKHVDLGRLGSGYPEAVRRAARLDEEAEAMDEAGRNPSTGVHRLAESIRMG